MDSLRKWFYKPKRDDRSLLAQFFFADETLKMVAAELDSFDGREDPDRCSTLVNQLRHAQEHVLNITGQIMDQILDERAPRGFRVKFPEDILQDSLAGQLWFGAECLAAGSSIMNREEESAAMRPLAKALTRSLETVRALLREHCLRCNQHGMGLYSCSEILHESLKIFDRLFAEFELCYVSAMVPVKSPREFEVQQHICVLFSETLQRARKIGLLTQEQVDFYDPALMFAIPRLAIVSGLLIFSNGPLSIDKPPDQMSEMFRPFRTLLHKIRELLWTLDKNELYLLEKLLCTNEDIANIKSNVDLSNGSLPANIEGACYPDISEFVTRFYTNYSHYKEVKNEVDCNWDSTSATQEPQSSTSERTPFLSDGDYLPSNVDVLSPILDGERLLGEITSQSIIEEPETNVEDDRETSVDDPSSNIENPHQDDIVLNIPITVDDCEIQNIDNEPKISNINSSRKNSYKNENRDGSEYMVRNLSSHALSMFDPLATSTSSENAVQLPDQNLVSDLSDLVSKIVDSMATISYDDPIMYPQDNVSNLLQDQIYSFSTNDISNLTRSRTNPDYQASVDNINYSPSRTDKVLSQLANMPSTSHGYLIPNAISQEPNVLAPLPDLDDNSILDSTNNTALNRQQVINTHVVDPDLYEGSISAANANLSSLLLTNEEYENNVLQTNMDVTSQQDVSTSNIINDNKHALKQSRAEFLVDYDSDCNEQTPSDSGICTENTSLDRSPDSETKELNTDKSMSNEQSGRNNFMKQNCILSNENSEGKTYDNRDNITISVDNCVDRNSNNIGSLQLSYSETFTNDHKNQAGTSHNMQSPEFITQDEEAHKVCSNVKNCDVNNDNRLSESSTMCSGISQTEHGNSNIDGENPSFKIDHCEDNSSSERWSVENNVSRSRSCSNGETNMQLSTASSQIQPESSNVTTVLHQRKLKKVTSPKKKKKSRSRTGGHESRMWTSGRVVLENRNFLDRRSPVRLNLDHFVDDGRGGSCSSQSSATSSFHSDCADDEEIALALQAQELASRACTRAKFRSSEDLIHRLFVCIAGVADQLQTNFATDLRNILKSVFLINQTVEEEPEPEPETDEAEKQPEDKTPEAIEYEVSESEVLTNGDSFDSIYSAEEVYADNSPTSHNSNNSLNQESDERNNLQNDLNERRSSQSSRRSSLSRHMSRRNTAPSVSNKDVTVEVRQEGSNVDAESLNGRNPSSSRSSSSQSSHSNSAQNTDSYLNSYNHQINSSSPSREIITQRLNTSSKVQQSRDSRQAAVNDTREATMMDRETRSARSTPNNVVEKAPEWIPDIAAPDCMRCRSHFTAFRRRHHCRNCGKVFCAACSANSIPLPRYGQMKPVRVCEECYRTVSGIMFNNASERNFETPAAQPSRTQTYTPR